MSGNSGTGGAFVYADIMQADTLPEEGMPLLTRVLERLKLIRLGVFLCRTSLSPEFSLPILIASINMIRRKVCMPSLSASVPYLPSVHHLRQAATYHSVIYVGTVATDKTFAVEHGLTVDAFHDHSTNVRDHYSTIRQRLIEKRSQFRCVREFALSLKIGLQLKALPCSYSH